MIITPSEKPSDEKFVTSLVPVDGYVARESVAENTDNQVDFDDDLVIGGTLIELPFLQTYPFEFDTFVNSDGLTHHESDRTKWITVTDCHLPSGKSMDDVYPQARCKFLGIEETAENIAEQRRQLKLHDTKYKSVCKDFIDRFFVMLCPHLQIVYDGTRVVENFSHIIASYCQCQTRNDVMKFVVLLYLSFDFVERYREKLTNAVLRQIGLRVVKSGIDYNKKKQPRKRINCFESITSVLINERRKSINRIGPNTCGWTITNIRPGYVLNRLNETRYRIEKHFYEWMINGERVSSYYIKILCLYTILYKIE